MASKLDHLLSLPGIELLPPAVPHPGHLLTIDVEEYFQVSAFEPFLPRERWADMRSRLEAPMDALLAVLEDHGHRGTFFVLGCVADRHPQLVRRIADSGHEVASHGQSHRRVTALSPRAFREELRTSKAQLEEITGTAVSGFRAPSFSIPPGHEWALDLLLEEGYRYDSSLFPIHRPNYGHPGAATIPHWIPRLAGRILEVPPTTMALAGVRLPVAGGAYFRLFPYVLTSRALRSREHEGIPGVVYLHPWELDPDQPRVAVPPLTRVRHYGGLRRVERRLEQLLREFRFTSIGECFASALAAGNASSEVAVV